MDKVKVSRQTLDVLISLFFSIILTSQATEPLLCKTLGMHLSYSEPKVPVEKGESGYYANAYDLKKKVQGGWMTRNYYDLNFKKKSDFKTIISFERKKFGPFKTEKEANSFACEAYYEAKMNILKKHKLAKPLQPKMKFDITVNPGTPANVEEITFNQNIGCRPTQPSLELWNWAYDDGLAYTFGYKGEYFSYEILKETDYDPFSLIQLRGPYKKFDTAAQVACELRYKYFEKKKSEFLEPKKNLTWDQLCQEKPIQFSDQSPFLNQYPRVGLYRSEREVLIKLEQLKTLNLWLAQYSKLSPEMRKQQISPDLMLTIEQILASKNKSLISQLVNFEKKAKGKKLDPSLSLRFHIPTEYWKMVLDYKSQEAKQTRFSTQWQLVPVVGQSRLGDLYLTSFDDALKEYCQIFKSYFNL